MASTTQTETQLQNLAAVLESQGAKLKTVVRNIPKPSPDEIVVRNYAIAANPVDWKIQDYGFAIKTYPTVLGSDGCGIVTDVGPSVTKFKKGDRVTGFGGVIGTDNPDHGSWQTYTVLRDIATTKIPDFMSFEQGSVFPMAMATSAMALFTNLRIPLPKSSIAPQNSGFLIWGASSSVGTAAVQLARNLGFKVFATASQTHHQYLKSLGAFEVFDYHDSDVVSKIVASAKMAGTPISLGFDCVSEGTTSQQSAEILLDSGGKGGKLCLVLPWSGQGEKPDGVEISQTEAYRAFVNQAEMGKWFFNEYLEKALQEKSILSAPEIQIVEGGIDGAQKALDLSKKGVSGKKLVVKVE
ncbi:related to NADPH:quinone reductase and related Zn-dependent oxidoreductases [Phialocephala subalpina]|uniref:Related to NADPH:quinone reductase and related Zn-dependent oxidoreductases n=1 Tax=Phialocephala subalpina TaxID=576137 RepID=A0A1L7XP30_9HELO|nr:related to NADPH:quinone reductase and related Zn-dependent oxidoreductases [Phialocephala subalpina]